MIYTCTIKGVVSIALWACFSLYSATAATFYVDPSHGDDSNDGSQEQPWRSIKAINNPKLVKPGDTVFLGDGYYGELRIHGRNNKSKITIAAANGQSARFTRIQISKSKNWHIKNVSVSHAFGPSSAKTPLVASDASSSYIVFEGVNATSIADASAWSAKEWRDNAADGFRLRGTHVKIINSRIENVRHAISIRAHNSEVSSNLISNFSGDGIRALGNDSIYKNNVISECYKVDDNHDDGIQSWTIGPDGKVGTGQVRNVVISGNKIIATKNPNRKHACSLQGIGLFDGMFVNWRIENNLIVTDHWHGITVMGAENVQIINNTVVDPLAGKPTAPWIAITAHKKEPHRAEALSPTILPPLTMKPVEKVSPQHHQSKY